jgi:hypothetical protein
MGALLISPFNVEWGCYVWAKGVEVSEFCLFLLVFLASCISSISPRFYFRKHAFCLLPLVTILPLVLALGYTKHIIISCHIFGLRFPDLGNSVFCVFPDIYQIVVKVDIFMPRVEWKYHGKAS